MKEHLEFDSYHRNGVDSRYGKTPAVYYMTASLFADGPGLGSGFKYTPAKDPLSEVLTP